MSYASDKAYRSEHDFVQWMGRHGMAGDRPRTTSLPNTDIGDFRGVPFVVSIKNWKRMELAAWCDELLAMVERSPWQTGLVVHKRRRTGVNLWYGTAPLGLWLPLMTTYTAMHAMNAE